MYRPRFTLYSRRSVRRFGDGYDILLKWGGVKGERAGGHHGGVESGYDWWFMKVKKRK